MSSRSYTEFNTEASVKSVQRLSLGDSLNATFGILGGAFPRFIFIATIGLAPAGLFYMLPIHALAKFCLNLISVMCVYSAVIWAVGQLYVNGRIDILACYRRVSWRVISVLALVVGAAIFSLVTGFLVAFGITTSSILGMLIAFSSILGLVVAGIYFVVTPQGVILEGQRPISALKRSFNLVQNNWWRTLLHTVTVLLVLLGASIVLAVPFGIASYLTSPEISNPIANMFLLLARVAVSALIVPLAAIATTLLYFDMRVRKENYDTVVLSREMLIIPV